MSTSNGAHHNVEDILASIRTSIADEADHTRHISGEIQMPVQSAQSGQASRQRRDMPVADEATDFELPAIFKPGHNVPAEKPKLLGRLSDALKSTNPAEPARARTVIPFEPTVPPRAAEPPAPLQRPMATVNVPRPPEPAPYIDNAPAAPNLKREMPTFFDTRVNKLGQWSSESQKAIAHTPQQQAAGQQAPQPQFVRQSPIVPQGNVPQLSAGEVDDAAAQLLRPMLKQWLQENMPKIVERALLNEMQGELPPPPGPGKPQR